MGAPATVVTMEPARRARRSTTVPMGTARARQEESPPVLTPLLDCTHALVTLGTLEMGAHVLVRRLPQFGDYLVL